jgi:hypothetical protein
MSPSMSPSPSPSVSPSVSPSPQVVGDFEFGDWVRDIRESHAGSGGSTFGDWVRDIRISNGTSYSNASYYGYKGGFFDA